MPHFRGLNRLQGDSEQLLEAEVVEQLLATYRGVKLPPHGDNFRDCDSMPIACCVSISLDEERAYKPTINLPVCESNRGRKVGFATYCTQ